MGTVVPTASSALAPSRRIPGLIRTWPPMLKAPERTPATNASASVAASRHHPHASITASYRARSCADDPPALEPSLGRPQVDRQHDAGHREDQGGHEGLRELQAARVAEDEGAEPGQRRVDL